VTYHPLLIFPSKIVKIKFPGRDTDPNERDRYGRTPLMQFGISAEMNQAWIDAGAKVDAVDNRGYGVLYHQCLPPCMGYVKPDFSALQVLLDAGAPRPSRASAELWKEEVRGLVTAAIENNEAFEFCEWLDGIARD
jgi:hypothetical protein